MLLREIFNLLLSTVAGLLGSALLLRMYLLWLRIARGNPMTAFCVALTEWLVGPCRRLVPLRGRFDGASFLAVILVATVFQMLLGLVLYGGAWHWFLLLPSVVVVLLRWALYLLMVLVIANALLSLINPQAPLAPTFDALTRPMLAPLRRRMPPIGGFDLSPLVVIVILQVALLVIEQVWI